MALLDLLLAEVGKKRPNDSLCDAFLIMIGQALAEARMALEDDASGPAAGLIAEVRQRHIEPLSNSLHQLRNALFERRRWDLWSALRCQPILDVLDDSSLDRLSARC